MTILLLHHVFLSCTSSKVFAILGSALLPKEIPRNPKEAPRKLHSLGSAYTVPTSIWKVQTQIRERLGHLLSGLQTSACLFPRGRTCPSSSKDRLLLARHTEPLQVEAMAGGSLQEPREQERSSSKRRGQQRVPNNRWLENHIKMCSSLS